VSLRERKKAATRQRIQDEAMRLFLERGYEATTVEEIAAAAGVSHMTFFRHYPSKDDVVALDDYDPLMAELIRTRPADEHPVERVRATVLAGLAAVYADNRDTILARAQLIQSTPGLRARALDNQRATEALFASALAPPGGEDALEVQVLAAACVAALVTAVNRWAEHPERAELPALVDRAFAALREQVG
jgi:AcrR family transcriptional regulator